MHVIDTHTRHVPGSPAAVFAALEAMGTADDRIWPAPSMPFERTAGPLEVGRTRERHGIIRAVLHEHRPERAIVWRAELPFLVGTHGFEVTPGEGGCEVRHVLDARLAWWFAPVWWLKVGGVHERLVERLLDRLCAEIERDEPRVGP